MPSTHSPQYQQPICAAKEDISVALQVNNLSARYPESHDIALHNINLTITRGQRIALVGANGAGKSTLLKVIAGLLPAQTGTVEIFGQTHTTCPQCLAYLPQRSHIDWHFPVNLKRLVMAGRYVHLGWFKRPTKHDHVRVDEALRALRLEDLAKRQIRQLSGGQQQRALFARAIVQQSDILLLDEPLNAVDQTTRQIIGDLLETLRQKGKTVVMATHNIDRLETEFDEAIFLSDGRQMEAKNKLSARPSPIYAQNPKNVEVSA